MRNYSYLKLFIILLSFVTCKEDSYVKSRPEGFGRFGNSILFFNQVSGKSPGDMPVYGSDLKVKCDLFDYFPNVEYGNGVFKILSNNKRSVFFNKHSLTVHNKEYMEIIEKHDLPESIINAYYAENDRFLLLGSDSIFRIYDLASKTHVGNSLKLKSEDKFALTQSSLVINMGKNVVSYSLGNLGVSNSISLAFPPGAMCSFLGQLYFVNSPDYILQYPEIHVYSESLNYQRKFSVPVYCIALDNIFPIDLNYFALCLVFQGKAQLFSSDDGHLSASLGNFESALSNCSNVSVIPEFSDKLPLIRYYKNNQWCFLLNSYSRYKTIFSTGGNRHDVCYGLF